MREKKLDDPIMNAAMLIETDRIFTVRAIDIEAEAERILTVIFKSEVHVPEDIIKRCCTALAKCRGIEVKSDHTASCDYRTRKVLRKIALDARYLAEIRMSCYNGIGGQLKQLLGASIRKV